MFHAERWAGAFLAVSGKNANEAFLCLGALSAQIKTVHGLFFGHNAGRYAAAKLEELLRDICPEETPATEYAIRFLCLLVERNCFRYIDRLLQKIERDLDAQNGILDVALETASPVGNGFEEELALMVKDRTGASGVKIKTSVRPELLGGYLLRMGSFYVDASLKGQLESVAAHLGENIDSGGRNG